MSEAIPPEQKKLRDPVKILLDMAEEGEVDPWNIDIVETTDTFLARLEELETLDIRVPARTLLYAAILLRMKSEELVEDEEPEEEPEEPEPYEMFFDVEDYPVPAPPVRRRARRPVTLDELIDELKAAERVERRKKVRRETREKKQTKRATMDDVMEIAHEEDLEDRIENVWKRLEGMFNGNDNGDSVRFSELVVDRTRRNIVNTYLPLLFLASRNKIRLEQPQIFEEIFIKPNGGTGLEEGDS